MKSLQPDWNNLAQQAKIPSIWDETKLNCPEFQKYFIPFSRNLNLVWNLHVWEGNEAEKTLQKNLTITTNKKIGVILRSEERRVGKESGCKERKCSERDNRA